MKRIIKAVGFSKYVRCNHGGGGLYLVSIPERATEFLNEVDVEGLVSFLNSYPAFSEAPGGFEIKIRKPEERFCISRWEAGKGYRYLLSINPDLSFSWTRILDKSQLFCETEAKEIREKMVSLWPETNESNCRVAEVD